MQVLQAPLGIQAPLLGNGGMGISRFLRPLLTPLVTAAQFQLRVHRVPQTAFLPTSFSPDWEVSDWEMSEPSLFQKSERPAAIFSEEAEHPVGHSQDQPEIQRYEESSQIGHLLVEPRDKKSLSSEESPALVKGKKPKSKAKPSKKDTSKKVTRSPEPLPPSSVTKKARRSRLNQDLQTPIESESQLGDWHEASETGVPLSAPALELETSAIQETEFDISAAGIDRKTANVDEAVDLEGQQPPQETERVFEPQRGLPELPLKLPNTRRIQSKIPSTLGELGHSKKGDLGASIKRSETFQTSSEKGDSEQGDRESSLQNLAASQSLKSRNKKGSKRSPIETEGLGESKKAEISQDLELASEAFLTLEEDVKITPTEDVILTVPKRSKNRRQDREIQATQADLIPDSETSAVTKTPQKLPSKRQRNKTQKNPPKLSPSNVVFSTEKNNLGEEITNKDIQRDEALSQPLTSFSQPVAGDDWDTELNQTSFSTEFEPLAEELSETPRVIPVSEAVHRTPSSNFPNIEELQSEGSQELGDFEASVRRSGSFQRSSENLANVQDSVNSDIANDLLEPFTGSIEQPKLEQPKLEQPKLKQPELEQPELDRPALSPESPKITHSSAPVLTDRQNNNIDSNSSIHETARCFADTARVASSPASSPFPINAPPEFIAADLSPQGFAVGGEVTTTAQPSKAIAPSDIIPVMLTPGEFVVNARNAQKHLPLLRQINQSGDLETPTSSEEIPQISPKPTGIQRQPRVPNLLGMETLGEQHSERQSEWRALRDTRKGSLQSGTFDEFSSSDPSPTYTAPPRIFRSKAPVSAPSRSSPSHFSTPSTWTSVEDLLSSSNSYPSFVPEQNHFSEMSQPVQVIQRQAYQGFAEGGEVMAPTSPSTTETMAEIIENPQSAEKETGKEAEAAGDIETLAQEIYQRLCRRLEIERERSGVYSGRSPW